MITCRREGSIICRELLGLEKGEDLAEPVVRTEEYYQGRPCVRACRTAAEIAEKYLLKNGDVVYGLAPKTARNVGICFFVLSFIPGLYCIYKCGSVPLIIGIICALATVVQMPILETIRA